MTVTGAYEDKQLARMLFDARESIFDLSLEARSEELEALYQRVLERVYLWSVPLGEYPELAAQGMKDTGIENYGGPIVTAGGLLFIGATIYDRKLRAFDSRTGKLLREGGLPFAGTATPITYVAGGRQFMVIATGGARDVKGPKGSAYVAFAIPGR